MATPPSWDTCGSVVAGGRVAAGVVGWLLLWGVGVFVWGRVLVVFVWGWFLVCCANYVERWCYGGRVAKDDGGLGVAAGLVRGAFLVNAVYAESAREYGLTPQQGQLLCVLMSQAYGMGELSAVLGLAKSSLTGLVDRTERNGLVRREADSRDTRAVRVALTPQGSALVEAFYAETCRRVEGLSAGLSDVERGLLGELLGRVVLANEVPVVFLEVDSGGFHGNRKD